MIFETKIPVLTKEIHHESNPNFHKDTSFVPCLCIRQRYSLICSVEYIKEFNSISLPSCREQYHIRHSFSSKKGGFNFKKPPSHEGG